MRLRIGLLIRLLVRRLGCRCGGRLGRRGLRSWIRLLIRLLVRLLRCWSGRRLGRRGREMDIGLGGLGRDVHLVLSDLALPLRRHLVARSLVRYHLRERLRLRRVRLLILRRRHRRQGLVGLLIWSLVLRLRRVGGWSLGLGRPFHRPLLGRRDRWSRLRCIDRLRLWSGRGLRRLLHWRFRHLGRGNRLLRDLLGSLRRLRAGDLGRGNAIVNEYGLGRPAFHAELVFGRGMVSAVGAEHQDMKGG